MTNKELYIEAINRIDDYFEYSNESAKDKKFVMSVIDQLTDQLSPLAETTLVFYIIEGDGAGSAYLRWFLTSEEAARYEDEMEEGYGESTISSVETIIGSDIYKMALDDV